MDPCLVHHSSSRGSSEERLSLLSGSGCNSGITDHRESRVRTKKDFISSPENPEKSDTSPTSLNKMIFNRRVYEMNL